MKLCKRRVVYGITTGFGSLCNVTISEEESFQLQENLIRTHASGYETLWLKMRRAIILIRINSLLKGVSGVSEETLSTLLAMLNKNLIPLYLKKAH